MILRIHSVLSPENQQQQEQEVNPKLIVTPKPNHQVLPPLPIARLLLGQRIGLYCDWHRSYGLRRSLLTGELQGTSCSLSWPMPRFEPNCTERQLAAEIHHHLLRRPSRLSGGLLS